MQSTFALNRRNVIVKYVKPQNLTSVLLSKEHNFLQKAPKLPNIQFCPHNHPESIYVIKSNLWEWELESGSETQERFHHCTNNFKLSTNQRGKLGLFTGATQNNPLNNVEIGYS